MKVRRLRTILTTALLLNAGLGLGCHHMSSKKIQHRASADSSPVNGMRYHLPKPHLVVTPTADNSGITVEKVMLPDPERTYTFSNWSLLAQSSSSLEITNGLLQSVSANADTSTIPAALLGASGEVGLELVKLEAKKQELEMQKRQQAEALVFEQAQAVREKIMGVSESFTDFVSKFNNESLLGTLDDPSKALIPGDLRESRSFSGAAINEFEDRKATYREGIELLIKVVEATRSLENICWDIHTSEHWLDRLRSSRGIEANQARRDLQNYREVLDKMLAELPAVAEFARTYSADLPAWVTNKSDAEKQAALLAKISTDVGRIKRQVTSVVRVRPQVFAIDTGEYDVALQNIPANNSEHNAVNILPPAGAPPAKPDSWYRIELTGPNPSSKADKPVVLKTLP